MAGQIGEYDRYWQILTDIDRCTLICAMVKSHSRLTQINPLIGDGHQINYRVNIRVIRIPIMGWMTINRMPYTTFWPWYIMLPSWVCLKVGYTLNPIIDHHFFRLNFPCSDGVSKATDLETWKVTAMVVPKLPCHSQSAGHAKKTRTKLRKETVAPLII